ncbi:MAG: hypothetical protein R3B72_33730 [Polyangiaceae bacterium]
MAKTVIVSDETVRALIEAHASLAAWYYQMADALRQAGAGVHPPSDEQRRAYAQAMAQHFPEIAAVVAEVQHPRPYVPPPVVAAPTKVVENEGISAAAPPADHLATPARVPGAPEPQVVQGQPSQPQPESSPPAGGPAPPAFVDPTKVKYE